MKSSVGAPATNNPHAAYQGAIEVVAEFVLAPRLSRHHFALRYRRFAERVLAQAGVTDEQHRLRLIGHQVRVAKYDLATLRLYLTFGAALVIAIVAAVISGHSATPAMAAHPNLPPVGWTGYVSVSVTTLLLGRLVTSRAFAQIQLSALLWLVAMAGGALALFLAAIAVHSRWSFVIALGSAALTLLAESVLLVALYFLTAAFYAWRGRAFVGADPDASATDAILLLLDRSSASAGWARSTNRAAMLVDLERLARAVDSGFARLMRAGESTTDRWTRGQATRAGMRVREMKRWVVTPTVNTQEHFRAWLVRTLSVIVDGRWDQLERSAEGPPSALAPWTTVRSAARELAVAVVPFIGLWAFRRSNPAAATFVPGWVDAVSAFWAVAGVLLWLEPSLLARAQTFRGLVDTLAGKGKSS